MKIAKPSYSYVPAQPGYFVIPFQEDFSEEEARHWSEAVVAWAIDADGFPVPVTAANGIPEEDYGLLLPDGRVQAYEESHPSVAEWLDDKKERHAAIKGIAAERRAARNALAAIHSSSEGLL